MQIKLKRKYRSGTLYKNQKSTSNMSGKNKKNKNKKKDKAAVVLGKKVLLVNLGTEPKYCAGTGRRLPLRGMVVEYNGKYYVDYEASSRA